jgi:hypothetical protein
MKYDLGNVAELVDRIRTKSPAYLDLLTAETDDEFEVAFTAILDKAVRHLEKTRRTFRISMKMAFQRRWPEHLRSPDSR